MNKLIINNCNIIEDFNNNKNIILVIKNKKYIYLLVNSLLNEDIENKYLLIIDDNNKQQNNDDFIEFIPSIFLLNFNSKKNLTIINKQIKNQYKTSIKETIETIYTYLLDLQKNICIDFDIELISNIDLIEDDILKLINFEIKDKYDSILDKIINYMKIINQLRKIKIFIFLNLSVYLNKEEIKLLLKESKYYDFKIILIENNEEIIDLFDTKRILDEDLCLID